MYTATTPTLNLKLNTQLTLSDMDKIRVTLKSTLHELTLNKERMTIDDEEKVIQVTLTQEETLLFNKSTIEVQVKMKDLNGYVSPTNVRAIQMLVSLDEEVM